MAIFSITILFLVSFYPFQGTETSTAQIKRESLPDAMVLPICEQPGPHLRRIGWGKAGLQFDVPERDVKVLGGEPDVDYVRYLIKPKTGPGYLELWFGPTAFNPDPDKELLINSVSSLKRNVVSTSGEHIGIDSSGKLQTGEVWRHTFIMIHGMEGARFRAGQENASLFNQIINSVCYVPSSKQ